MWCILIHGKDVFGYIQKKNKSFVLGTALKMFVLKMLPMQIIIVGILLQFQYSFQV